MNKCIYIYIHIYTHTYFSWAFPHASTASARAAKARTGASTDLRRVDIGAFRFVPNGNRSAAAFVFRTGQARVVLGRSLGLPAHRVQDLRGVPIDIASQHVTPWHALTYDVRSMGCDLDQVMHDMCLAMCDITRDV